MPEDDKDAQRLNDMKSIRVRSEGYNAPKEQASVSSLSFEGGDLGYHSRYGADEGHGDVVPHSPLEERGYRDMGYHGTFFRD